MVSLGDILADPLLVPIWAPLAAGLVVACIPRPAAILSKIIAALTVLFAAVWGVLVWAAPEVLGAPETLRVPAWNMVGAWAGEPVFSADALSGFAGAAAGVLAFLMTLYAVGFSREEDAPSRRLYSGILLSVGATFGSLYAENLIVLAIFWGFLGIPFFLLLNMGKEGASAAAKKAFLTIGGTDSLLILGIAMVLARHGRLAMHGPQLSTESAFGAVAYICFLAAALAKAGAIPLHTWIPGAAATAPIPAVALLPASLDKVLGIYLLARISLTLFKMSGCLSALVMVLGAVTVIAAVFMALIQHDLRKLLGFHAVSQVGYMILGIGTGTFVGIAGGLFHALNNAIYKSCLFLTAGSAERKTGTSDLGKLGGLATALPVTFVTAAVAALAISGVPPLNGFVSKWMVYQGLVETGKDGSYLWILLLAAATFGSALTLASFVKVIYSVYLAPRPADEKEPSGPGENVFTILPMAALALACVVFGVAAFRIPLAGAIYPAVEESLAVARPADLAGFWSPGIATILMLLGVAAGAVIYMLGTAFKAREDSPYVGGEDAPDHHFGGPDFYETVTRISPFSVMYERAAKGLYDLYEWGLKLAAYVGTGLRAGHSGLLLTYVAWFIAGVVVLLWVTLGRTL